MDSYTVKTSCSYVWFLLFLFHFYWSLTSASFDLFPLFCSNQPYKWFAHANDSYLFRCFGLTEYANLRKKNRRCCYHADLGGFFITAHLLIDHCIFFFSLPLYHAFTAFTTFYWNIFSLFCRLLYKAICIS